MLGTIFVLTSHYAGSINQQFVAEQYFTIRQKLDPRRLNLNGILVETKIIKQLKNIKDLRVRGLLRESLLSIRDQFRSINWDELLYRLDRYILAHDPDNSFFEQLTIAFSFVAELMDLYLLARLFRSYSVTKYRYSDESKNVIIYAGSHHCIRYRIFLSQLGFVERAYIQSKDDNQCLDIAMLPQPLFGS